MGHEKDERRDLAVAELERERDMAIARADEAEERERIAQDRLRELAPLEARIEVAERRALDAERRLDEITSRVAAASGRDDRAGSDPADDPSEHVPAGDDLAGDDSGDREAESVPPQVAELRARLARSAPRKKPGGTRET
ncbi:MAG: hypothetical protein ACRDGK_01705 [Actinomycetota bacterium]